MELKEDEELYWNNEEPVEIPKVRKRLFTKPRLYERKQKMIREIKRRNVRNG